MIARRRVDVADLNARARARMRESGALSGPTLQRPGGSFAVGDRVVVNATTRGRPSTTAIVAGS
jgi:ATP-dependent exoDNAse (exonuclease V) alpha subunit